MRKLISICLVSLMVLSIAVPAMAALTRKDSCSLGHDIVPADWNISATSSTVKYTKGNTIGPVGSLENYTTDSWGLVCLLDTILTVTDWIFNALVIASTILVIWGGWTLTTSGGDEKKVSKGREWIMFAMIGLAMALLSKAVPSIVMAIVS